MIFFYFSLIGGGGGQKMPLHARVPLYIVLSVCGRIYKMLYAFYDIDYFILITGQSKIGFCC